MTESSVSGPARAIRGQRGPASQQGLVPWSVWMARFSFSRRREREDGSLTYFAADHVLDCLGHDANLEDIFRLDQHQRCPPNACHSSGKIIWIKRIDETKSYFLADPSADLEGELENSSLTVFNGTAVAEAVGWQDLWLPLIPNKRQRQTRRWCEAGMKARSACYFCYPASTLSSSPAPTVTAVAG